MTAKRFLPLVLVLSVSAGLVPGRAADEPDDRPRTQLVREVSKLAGQIKAVLERQKAELKVEIRNVISRADQSVNFGPGLQEMLQQHLTRAEVHVVKKAPYLIEAAYSFRDANGLRTLHVECKLFKLNTNQEVNLEAKANLESDDMRDLTSAAGLTASLNPKGDARERNEQLTVAMNTPTVYLHGDVKTRVSSTKESPYYVEILAGPPMKTRLRSVQAVEGQAYVAIDRAEEYALRIVNTADHEVAVRVSVDGIDTFAFSEDRTAQGEPRFTHYILARKGELVLQGWHKNAVPGRYKAFQVVEYGAGAASLLKVDEKSIGQIHVAFARSYDPRTTARGRNETGFGRDIQVKQEPVRRYIEPAHDFVTIRYNRKEN